MQRPHIVCAAVALLAAAALMPARAWAHALLDHATPRVGSTVHESPAAVTLTFTEPIEPDFSRVEIFDANDHRVETALTEHPKADQLRVPLPVLAPGEYTVHWAVTSIDTHQTEGRFAFTFAAP
jgi:methionine-rich copper-binding protein CopC